MAITIWHLNEGGLGSGGAAPAMFWFCLWFRLLSPGAVAVVSALSLPDCRVSSSNSLSSAWHSSDLKSVSVLGVGVGGDITSAPLLGGVLAKKGYN